MSEIISRAQDFARKAHKGQKDDSGQDYFTAHIVPVASAVKVFTGDEEIIAAAYLHDTVEDTPTTPEDLLEYFGQRVASLVMEVTHDGQADEYGYYFPRLKTAEGILIKLCDRASNISRMENWSEERRQAYLRKTVFWKNGEDREFRKRGTS